MTSPDGLDNRAKIQEFYDHSEQSGDIVLVNKVSVQDLIYNAENNKQYVIIQASISTFHNTKLYDIQVLKITVNYPNGQFLFDEMKYIERLCEVNGYEVNFAK